MSAEYCRDCEDFMESATGVCPECGGTLEWVGNADEKATQ